MKKLLLLTSLLLATTWASAQIASDICLTEVKAAFRQIDAQSLLAASEATRIDYTHTYVMRTDPEKKERTGEEVRMYDQGTLYHDSPDQLTITDKQEAFNHRKGQFVVYRTRSSIAKANILPLSNQKLFDHCFVRECHFVPVPDNDSISHKRAFMTLDADGQKKFQIKDLEIVTNPHDTTLISITANFTPKSLYTKATYTFHAITKSAHNPQNTPKNHFLNAEGKLKEDFKGVELKDYR